MTTIKSLQIPTHAKVVTGPWFDELSGRWIRIRKIHISSTGYVSLALTEGSWIDGKDCLFAII